MSAKGRFFCNLLTAAGLWLISVAFFKVRSVEQWCLFIGLWTTWMCITAMHTGDGGRK